MVNLGATWDGAGVHFALYSAHATGVELCLFDSVSAGSERRRVPLHGPTDHVWSVYVPGVGPGQLYGYRVSGPWDPAAGHRFDPSKLLLDPYARVIARSPAWHDALLSQAPGSAPDSALVPSDSAPYAALGAVADPAFDWGDDRSPRTAWQDTVIYELHVKGFTAAHPDVDRAIRGTYLGAASEPAIAHLRSLGVTAVELLPIHHHVDERRLVQHGLVNYWGYNTLNYFTPAARFVSTRNPLDAAREFKTMVRRLHRAGLEVILDVVYNHTAEGDHRGPTFSWRGIDNAAYYRLKPADRARYDDVTGCGNTVDAASPAALRMIMDSLRYWVEEMHVDGFRFDLTTALAREVHGYDPGAGFLDAVAQDPVLRHVKLIAEPWDLGPDGYQVARFPVGWTEWNDRYRSTVRRFWRGDPGVLPEFATRLAGSSDLYGLARRGPRASLNFVTSHDGFTLADLVSYDRKHNEANREENRDGESQNHSWNSGVEGEASDAAVVALRERQRRNLLLTLFVSQGVPMISGGDELGRTQHGNNNAYCHDSPLTWTKWPVEREDDDPAARRFLAFAARAAEWRRTHPLLRLAEFPSASPSNGSVAARWLRPEGGEFGEADWADPNRQTIGLLLTGQRAEDAQLILFNASAETVSFALPQAPGVTAWHRALDTADPGLDPGRPGSGATMVDVAPRSVAVFVPLAHDTNPTPSATAPIPP